MAQALKFKSSMHGLKLNRGKFTKELDSAAQVAVREAARSWLRAVITKVPVFTGFALGSVKFAQGPNGNLGRYLNVAIPIDPRSNIPKYYYPLKGRRVEKTPENAGRFGEYNFTSGSHRYVFWYRTDVIHYIYNEFYAGMVPSAPWRSFKFAEKAFQVTLKDRAENLPKVKDYVITTNIE